MTEIQQLARAWAKAWMSDDTEAFVRLFAPKATYRDDQAGRFSNGPDELRSFHTHFAAAISDFRLMIVTEFRSGELACLEWISSGRQTGIYHGRPPTGRSFRVPGASVIRFAPDLKVLSCVDYYDGRLLAQQLSVAP